MSSLTIGAKVRLLLAVAMLFLALVAAAGFAVASRLSGVIDGYGTSTVPAFEALASLAAQVAQAASQASAVESQSLDEAAHQAALAQVERDVADAREQARVFDALPHDPEVAKAWTEVRRTLDAWLATLDAFRAAARQRATVADNFAQAAAFQSTVSARFEDMRRQNAELILAIELTTTANRAAGDALRLEAAGVISAARWTLGLVSALAVLLLGAGGLAIAAQARRSVASVLAESGRLERAVHDGALDVRADEAAVDPEFRPVVAGMNATLEAFVTPFQEAAGLVRRIAAGEPLEEIRTQAAGDFNALKDDLNEVVSVVGRRGAEVQRLIDAAVAGHLDVRGDAAGFRGDHAALIAGVNAMLDALVGPLQVAAEHVARISRGDVPAPITAEYRGQFAAIKDNLNACIAAVGALVADADRLARAGVEGRLGVRADASRHLGDFRKVVEGVNATLDAVIGPLEVAAGCVDQISHGRIPPRVEQRWAGDFGKLETSLNGCIDAVNLLVADAGRLVEAAVAGQLATRAEAARHQGDFRTIVEGVNRTLDAVLAPVNEAAGVLERLADRDLTARVGGTYQGDHARIQRSVNATGEALQEALVQVAAAVEQVSSAATQIATSAQAVASGASEQASSLQSTGGAIEAVSATTRHSADGAQQANGLATAARGAATEGAAAVAQMQGAMGRIRQSAEGTSQIIRDINDIAFQTNLLALNAAVEAARAGEAGRGFAVVAEEVRSLALRAKEAAHKTEALIRQSVKEAGEGEATSRQVAGKLAEIVTGIAKVSDLVSEIAASAKEQAAGIEQVHGAIGEMDKVTQQNAASAEQSSSAASELSGQSEELAAMVATFRLEAAAAAPHLVRPGHAPRALHAARPA